MWNKWDVIGGLSFILVVFSCYTILLHQFSISTNWIGYYGSVLGALISIGVIAFTIRQNNIHHKELMEEQNKKHEELKQLQVNTILYSNNQKRLQDIANELLKFTEATNYKHLFDVTLSSIYPNKTNNQFLNELNSKIQEFNTSYERILMLSTINKDIIDLKPMLDIFMSYQKDYEKVSSEMILIVYNNLQNTPSYINTSVTISYKEIANTLKFNKIHSSINECIISAKAKIESSLNV